MINYELRLYISGQTPQAERAVSNLDQLCKGELGGSCAVEVINLIDSPERADEDKIIATPTLIRLTPTPIRRIIGDLSDRARVVRSLCPADGESDPLD